MKSVSAICAILFALSTPNLSEAQSTPSAQPRPVLPSSRIVRPTYPSYSQRPQDEAYRIAGRTLTCIISDGDQVRISVASDADDFLFLAIQSPLGRAILANDRRVTNAPIEYAVFSFFRECAVHSLAKVTATSESSGPGYDRAIIAAADCLAVLPTTRGLPSSEVAAYLGVISRGLQQEYGPRYATEQNDLMQCTNPEYAQEVARRSRGFR